MPRTLHQQRGSGKVMRAAWRLSLDAALEEVVETFADVDVRPLLLKGPAFARWLYDDPSERTYVDLDLLAAPAEFEAARRALAARGFEQVAQRAHPHQREHHETWMRRSPPAAIELHHTVFLLEAPPTRIWQRFDEHADTVLVGSCEVRIPGPAASALLVALHALLHGIGVRQPLRDLERALELVEPATWRRARELSRDLGGEEAFAAGLRLLPEGRRLATQLELPERPPARRLRLLAGTRETAIAIERLLATPGFRARVGVVLLTLVPSPPFMRARYELARRSRRGLLCAYLLRPFELAVKLPGAMRAWLKAAAPAQDR